MDVQLVTDEGDGDLAAMWQVADGKAAFVEPGPRLPDKDLTEATFLQRMLPGGERGVTVGRLREALAQVRSSSGGTASTSGSPA